MSRVRDTILQRIRQANQHLPDQHQPGVTAQNRIEQRLQQHPRGPQPAWPEDLLTRFKHKAMQSAASIETVTQPQDIVDAVMSYLAQHSLEQRLVCASTPLLNRLAWMGHVTPEFRSATTDDKVVLVEAFAAIAETGSVVMCSSRETPVSLNFLPDHYLCVVNADNVVSTIDAVWDKIRNQGLAMPRAVNLITGPSRTADVEQIIQMGAHGPRKVHLFLAG